MSYNFIRSIEKIENELKKGLIEKEKGIAVFKGEIPILLSAPHSVEQTRDGKLKYGEGRTASIVQTIHEREGCFATFKTMNFQDDANYDDRNYYKDELISIVKNYDIKLLLDFHIMEQSREHNIDIGTGVGKNILNREDLLQIIKRDFETNAIGKVEVDYLFSASFKNTVSASISRECHIPCFQIEINWGLLDETLEGNMLENIIDAISKIIKDLREAI